MARKTRRQLRSYQRKADQPTAITPIEYSGLQEAYDHFNKTLFEGTLDDVFITYQRKAHSAGYFSPDRFSGRGGNSGKHHELALNPDGFINQTDQQICQTVVHEMTHRWQHQWGTPSERRYHNKEWAAKMKAIGLQPSSTGMVGGKETGQRMSDYIIPSGPFTKAFAKLAATGWNLNLQSAHQPGPKGGNDSKTPFTRPACGQNAWGKPGLAVICTPCVVEALCQHPRFAGVTTLIEPYQMRSKRAAVAVAPDDSAPTPSHEITEPSIVPSTEPTQTAKRKPGRPKGSKNKPKTRKRPATVSARPHGGESECAKASSNL
jgi:predicted SprT family Zn-dependent metalloprotease